MPTPWHDILTKTFEERPELAVDLLRDGLGYDLPRNALVRAESGGLSGAGDAVGDGPRHPPMGKKIFGLGKAEGEAESVLTVLEERGIEVPRDVRERITSCTGLDQLETWLRRAVTVRSAAELFDAGGA
ncbi:hypothetical protein ACSNOI_35605 [Actinomadura kijaniata]|uniref:hypothetical protein n=1 Tax=Actinomadura kijaniata TaxID=46161 RepID=UPI003F1AA086